MSGLVGMPTRFEEVPGTEQLVMSDSRDFTRPRPSFYQEDINLSSDEELERLLPGISRLDTFKKELKKEPKEEKKDKIDNKKLSIPDNSIKIFQSFFSKSLPIVGKLYSGPIDGIYNDQLQVAAKNIEDTISKETGASAAGLVFNSSAKTFNTTVDDIESALKLISTHKKTQKLPKLEKE